MDAVRRLPDGADELRRHGHALRPLVRGALEALDDGLRDMDAPHVLVHVARHLRRLDEQDPRQHRLVEPRGDVPRGGILREAARPSRRTDGPHSLHERAQLLGVEHRLCLEELRAAPDLGLELLHLHVQILRSGVGRRPDAERRLAGERFPRHVVALGQPLRCLHERGGVDVKNRLGLGMVSGLRVVAGQEEDVPDAEEGGPEEVRLQREAVAVATGDLEDRVRPGVQHRLGHRQGAGPHDGAGAVGDVDRVHQPLHPRHRSQDLGEVGPLGRVDLHRHQERLAAELRLEALGLRLRHAGA